MALLVCALMTSQAQAAESSLSLEPFEGSIPVTQFIYISDFTEEHSIALQAEVLAIIQEQLVPSTESSSAAERFGFNWSLNSQEFLVNDSATGLTWFYIDLTNSSNTDFEVYLEVSGLDGVGWIYRDSTDSYEIIRPSYDSYIGGRVVFDRDFVLPIDLVASETRRVYGYAFSVSTPREGTFKVWNPESFRENRAKRFLVDGAYYGFLLSLVLLNLALFVTMRQISYFYASIFQLGVGTLVLFGSGYSNLLVFPNNLNYIIPAYGVVFCLIGISSGLFNISILQIRNTHSTLYKIWMGLVAFNVSQIPIIVLTSLPSDLDPNANTLLLFISLLFFLFAQAVHIYTLFYYWKRTTITKYWFTAVTLQVWILIAWQLAFFIGYDLTNILRYVVQIFTAVNGMVLVWLVGHVVRSEQQQRAQAQEEALRSLQIANDIQQSKANFISTAGHDLRQPLEAIRLHINALQETAPTTTSKVLTKVEGNVKELSALLHSLMNLSQSTAQTEDSQDEDFLLSDVMESLRDEAEPFAGKKGLSLDIQKTSVSVNTSKVGLTQILRNILFNSIKFTKAGGVKVEIQDLEENVLIRIVDTGCGMPQQELDKIFTEFYQVGHRPKGTEYGMGLGLSIVERLAKSLNISVQVDSAIDQGTKFELQIAKGASAPETATYSSADPASLSGLRVAVLNAKTENATAIKTLLENWGASALAFVDLVSADQYIAFHNWHPDILIVTEEFYRKLIGHDDLTAEQVIEPNPTSTNSSLRNNVAESAIPILILYSPSEHGKTVESSASATRADNSKNENHYWFEDPINPGVLRSFIQRMVISSIK